MNTTQREQLVKKLLTKVKKKISQNPKAHKQDIWIQIPKEPYIDTVCDLKSANSKYNCTTPCCFAGHIVYESTFNFKALMENVVDGDSIEEAAAKIISTLSDSFWRYITRGDFGMCAGKSKQTKLYIKLLDLIIKGRSEDYIKAHLLEFFPNELFSRDKANLKSRIDTDDND